MPDWRKAQKCSRIHTLQSLSLKGTPKYSTDRLGCHTHVLLSGLSLPACAPCPAYPPHPVPPRPACRTCSAAHTPHYAPPRPRESLECVLHALLRAFAGFCVMGGRHLVNPPP